MACETGFQDEPWSKVCTHPACDCSRRSRQKLVDATLCDRTAPVVPTCTYRVRRLHFDAYPDTRSSSRHVGPGPMIFLARRHIAPRPSRRKASLFPAHPLGATSLVSGARCTDDFRALRAAPWSVAHRFKAVLRRSRSHQPASPPIGVGERKNQYYQDYAWAEYCHAIRSAFGWAALRAKCIVRVPCR